MALFKFEHLNMSIFFDIILHVFGFVFIVMHFYKLILKLTSGKFYSDVRMDGKVILITGANTGIGKETAKDLAKRGAKIIMACRNLQKAREARDEIIKETNNDKIIVKQLDLSSQKSVRDFSCDILRSEKVIDVLINNAGIALGMSKAQSVDGIELTFATNHYGPFLLTHLLIDLLKKSKQGRIVVVSSKNHHIGPINLKNLNPIDCPLPFHLYNVTKSANILFTLELAKRLKDTKITANCLHPGVVDTEIFKILPFPLSLIRIGFRTPAEGAQTSLFLACSPDVQNISGQYFRACKATMPNKKVLNDMVAVKLWDESKKIVKLSEDDPQI